MGGLSGTVDDRTEGLTIFLPPDQAKSKWLSEYGCFGPRRPDAFSGTRFTLRKGEVLKDHGSILVHKGDIRGGKVLARSCEWRGSGSVS